MVKVPDRTAVYPIGVVAELMKIHPRTLRIYEECKLVCPARTAGNNRLYSQADLDLIARIRYLTQERGVNLAGVKIILELEEMFGQVVTNVVFERETSQDE
ncbi:MerR family transcriptional regulator [Desulforudis sp. 1088]